MSAAIDEEEEILLSIFPDEFEKISDDAFKIRLDPEPLDGDNDSLIPPILYLTAQLPPAYPETIPHLSITTVPSENGTDLTSDDITSLLTKLDECSTENLGMAMIFTLVTSLREELNSLLDRRKAAAAAELAARQAAVQAEEQKRFEGTKVTRESFTAWNVQFKAELARRAATEEESVKVKGGERKLTGRQLFEGDTTLAASDLKIGDATDVEFDFSKFDKTTRHRGDEDDEEEEDEVRHWAAETI